MAFLNKQTTIKKVLLNNICGKKPDIFEVLFYPKFSCEKFGPFINSVFRIWVVRSWVLRSSVVRVSWVVERWVVRSSVSES